jgi:hypothetical protein
MGDEMVKQISSIFILLLILFLPQRICAQSSPSGIVINEVLANEPGSKTNLEWVELHNLNSCDVDLGGFRFICKSDTTVIATGTFILPKGYLILARKLVAVLPDSTSFEGYWGNNSGIWGDTVAENFPAIQAKMSLFNSGGTVSIIDLQNNLESFTWDKDTKDGFSWEKVYPDSGDEPRNWSSCLYEKGNTPGKINSVTPAENDLSLKSEGLYSSSSLPEENQVFILNAKVRNAGTEISKENSLSFFCDYNFDGNLGSAETLKAPQLISPLVPSDSSILSIELSFPEGNYRIYALVGADDKIYNNTAWTDVRVGGGIPDIVINEFMSSPNSTQAEWVELYNRKDTSLCIKDWAMGDSIRQNLITDDEIWIPPDEYLIITQDIAKFISAYPDADCAVMESLDWEVLNNTGDKIILRDSLGFIVDQVSYDHTWESGISSERISSEKPSNDKNNWWRCVDLKGATPCKKNSNSVSYSEKIEFEISFNPFSPDGDGFEDTTVFEYKLPLKSEISIKIYDIKGRSVKTIMEDQPQVSGEISWNGKDDDNRTVRAGIYVVYVEVKGEKKSSLKTTLVVAKR